MSEQDTVVDGLVRLSFLVQRVLADASAVYEVSVAQTRLLGVLDDREPGVLDLARLLGVDKSSVTGLVDRAVQRGLVERVIPSENRRTVRISLTAHGRAIGSAIRAEVYRRIGALLADFSDTDRTYLGLLAEAVLERGSG